MNSLPHTPALMVQGTSSNAGKSLLTAGICRALARQGVRVAPFKAQNMSLNSYVTPAGCEIGRAQALQAQACGLEPDTRMNPVLLKPNSNTGSQVIVLGKPVANMEAREYFQKKLDIFDTVKQAYNELAAEYDAIILEGAGSPAEINLKRHDIVNMNMARHARAKVLLTGDIDRGGVFASLIGTMACFEPWEQDLVAGFVLNKFRGDASLLDEALEFTTQRTGKPFYGVLPYLERLGLPEEDSVNFKEAPFRGQSEKDAQCLEIGCVDLPHISNFTDFDALDVEPDVRLRILRTPEDARGRDLDAIIIPGSKSTLSDLAYLRDTGLDSAITRHAARGGEVVGICGGLQILGEHLLDPTGLESTRTRAPGLGLLPLSTEIMPEKTLVRASLTHAPTGLAVEGYEIHHGQSSGTQSIPVFANQGGEPAGYADKNGHVWGTYLHGVFDADAFRRHWLDQLRVRREWTPKTQIQARYELGPGLDRLADAIQEHLDWSGVLALLGL